MLYAGNVNILIFAFPTVNVPFVILTSALAITELPVTVSTLAFPAALNATLPLV